METLSLKPKNRFIGAKVLKTVSFMGQELEISKLTVSQILQIQNLANETNKSKDAEAANLKLLVFVIKEGASELKDLTDDDFKEFPMDELSTLSTSIMEYSGLVGKQ